MYGSYDCLEMQRYIEGLWLICQVITSGILFLTNAKIIEKVAHIEADLFEVGHISSPGFPNIYPSPQNATSYQYIIQHKGALDKLFIRVVFDDHDLAPRDKLKYYESNNLRQLERWDTNSHGPRLLYPKKKYLHIHFEVLPGDKTGYVGFSAQYAITENSPDAKYAVLPYTGCGTVKSIGGVIRRSHRDDPNNIKLLYDCVWVMKTPHPNIFSYINILGMELDNYSWGRLVEIRNGSHSQAPLLASTTTSMVAFITVPKGGFTSRNGLYLRLKGDFTKKGVFFTFSYAYFTYKQLTENGTNYFCYLSLADGNFSGYGCANDRCVDWSLLCDGADQCGDNSDEICPGLESTVPTTAPPCERPRKLCPDGRCVTNRRECQPDDDLSNSCSLDYELCPGSFTCIRIEDKCDGVLDCEFGEDEQKCTRAVEASRPAWWMWVVAAVLATVCAFCTACTIGLLKARCCNRNRRRRRAEGLQNSGSLESDTLYPFHAIRGLGCEQQTCLELQRPLGDWGSHQGALDPSAPGLDPSAPPPSYDEVMQQNKYNQQLMPAAPPSYDLVSKQGQGHQVKVKRGQHRRTARHATRNGAASGAGHDAVAESSSLGPDDWLAFPARRRDSTSSSDWLSDSSR